MKSIKLAATAMTDLAGAAFADDSASVSVLRVGSQSTEGIVRILLGQSPR